MNIKDGLIEARNVINIDGWASGTLRTLDNRYCLIGALGKAANVNLTHFYVPFRSDPDENSELYFKMLEAVGNVVQNRMKNVLNHVYSDFKESDHPQIEMIYVYNDRHCGSKEEMLSVFDEAVRNLDV